MGVSIIEGTIAEAVPGRRAFGVRFFKRIVFRLPDGGSRTVARPVVHSDLAERLQPGASGRFYLFAAFDHRGIHGFRDAHGRGCFHFPRNNEVATSIVMILVALWVGYVLFAWGGLPIFWTLLLLLGVPAWLNYRHVRMAAQRQFAADGHHAPASASPVSAEPAVGS